MKLKRKVFFTFYKILAKVLKSKPGGKPIRIWSRASVIFPEYIGYTFEIHNGKNFIKLTVSENHVFHRFGEFSPTRKYPGNRVKKDSKV
jgi:small subunit ribosomal protein S19